MDRWYIGLLFFPVTEERRVRLSYGPPNAFFKEKASTEIEALNNIWLGSSVSRASD